MSDWKCVSRVGWKWVMSFGWIDLSNVVWEICGLLVVILLMCVLLRLDVIRIM